MEASFYSIEISGENFPGLPEIIDKFAEIHKERGCPDGDDLDLQMEMMLMETCTHFNIGYVSLPGDVYIFYPLSLDREKVQELISEAMKNQN